VLVEGRRINSCLTLAVMHEGQHITTVEGLASTSTLSPVQRAFIERDAFQCGFCTPGQLCSATACLTEFSAGTASAATPDVRTRPAQLSDAEIRERMSGNICRCGAYANIVAAVRDAHTASA
jgi:xanthine dehydrogenase YagT iron-sulfur-binding subunit